MWINAQTSAIVYNGHSYTRYEYEHKPRGFTKHTRCNGENGIVKGIMRQQHNYRGKAMEQLCGVEIPFRARLEPV
jgi:hypothetical protein